MTKSSDLVIGVDGGGTKTVAWLAPLAADADLPPLGRGEAGPGNPRAAGFDLAQANIDAAIAAAFEGAKLPQGKVASACFGLAGAGRAEEQQRVTDWAASRDIAETVRVVPDAELVLAAGSPDDWGIALICGTGSLAWGRSQSGEVARCGGWGYLIGDEGSAYAIARAGLQAAVRSTDGRGPATLLVGRFLGRLQAEATDGLIASIYGPGMTRERLAGLAQVVFETAPTDEVAQEILEQAATHVAELIATLSRRLGLTAGEYPLALAGGVIVHQAGFRDRVMNQLAGEGTSPGDVVVVESPVQGAVVLARRATGQS